LKRVCRGLVGYYLPLTTFQVNRKAETGGTVLEKNNDI
jgi:hypothetical protein